MVFIPSTYSRITSRITSRVSSRIWRGGIWRVRHLRADSEVWLSHTSSIWPWSGAPKVRLYNTFLGGLLQSLSRPPSGPCYTRPSITFVTLCCHYVNAGCTVTFTKINCTISYHSHTKICGNKCTRMGMWMVPLTNPGVQATSPSATINNSNPPYFIHRRSSRQH
jgi:hypothetical protein